MVKGSIGRPLAFIIAIFVVFTILNLAIDYRPEYRWSDAPRWMQNSGAGACVHFLSAKSEGRLGNQMGEYASLYAHARRLGVKAVIPEEMARFLEPIFPNISIPSEKGLPECQFSGVYISKTDIALINSEEELFSKSMDGGNTLMINKFPMEVPFFHPYRRELTQSEFAIDPDLLARVQLFLNRARSAKYPDLSPSQVLFVGVHARRTDYREFLRINWGGHTVSKLFFTHAMETYRARYPRQKFLFLVVSDDVRWIKRMFRDEEEVVLAMTAGVELRGREGSNTSAMFDMAVQASCNHSIMR